MQLTLAYWNIKRLANPQPQVEQAQTRRCRPVPGQLQQHTPKYMPAGPAAHRALCNRHLPALRQATEIS